MKIHSDVITSQNISEATRAAGMRGVYEEHTTHGSRQRARSFNVKLTGNSTRRQNPGTSADRDVDFAATWDEWGMFIQALFVIDPEAIIGQYKDYDAFQLHTADRFENLTAPYSHGGGGHHWISKAPYVQECSMCDATRRFDVLR